MYIYIYKSFTPQAQGHYKNPQSKAKTLYLSL